MLQTKIKLRLKDDAVIEIIANRLLLNDASFVPSKELRSLEIPLLLLKNHDALNTTLHVSEFPPCTILKFDRQKEFTSVAFSLKQSSGTFTIAGTENFFLILPLPIPKFLNNITSFTEK